MGYNDQIYLQKNENQIRNVQIRQEIENDVTVKGKLLP
jgi:hypothetical protein